MKRIFTLLLLFSAFIYTANAQTKPGPAERELTDTVCNCLTRVDLSKIKGKQDAIDAITDCFSHRTDLLMKAAEEKHIDATDDAAMRGLGTSIGKNLLNENCSVFLKLSEKMVSDKTNDENDESSTTGIFKRIDNKGFYYIIISSAGVEKSFLWLRQFPNSEKLMNGTTGLVGKKIKIAWREIEVYLPLAKGYYKIKEITGIEFL